MKREFWLAGAALALMPVALLAQAKKKPAASAPVQQVIPPKTVYWLSAATASGIVMGGRSYSTGDMLRMAMGGGMDKVQKNLSLDLGSKLPPSGPPASSHAIPPEMKMGAALALKTPKHETTTYKEDTPAREEKPDFERPKGRLLLFWGCGETARPGQPIVIDFAKMAAGEMPPNLFGGERVRVVQPPSEYSWPTYGHWPNDDRGSKQSVPMGASLIGAHKVTGNYTPQIDFTLAQDWMAPLDMKQDKAASGALNLSWNAVPGATAHFAQMFGFGGTPGKSGNGSDGDATIVFWTSSEVQTFISGLSDYIAPAEAARLVGKKQLMPPTQTSCAIPKEAMAAAPSGFLTLVAHGPEQNFVYPPRPADPRTPWVQDWTVKARFVARTGAMAGMAMPMGASSAGTGKSGKPKCQPDTATMAGESVGGAIGGAIGGLFGKKKKAADCE